MEDDFGLVDSTSATRNAKSGRRAPSSRLSTTLDTLDVEDNTEISSKPVAKSTTKVDKDDGPPKPSRVSGWGEDAPRKRGRNLGEGFEQFDDERLRPKSPEKDEDSDHDIPVIPDLEEQQEDDMTNQVAVAPNVAVNRVATYRELDNDLLRKAAFLTLDNEIDLKLLTKSLCTEADLIEEDKPWDWDRLFTEVTSEILTQIEKDEKADPESSSSSQTQLV
ncbi:hypothetical protein ACJMK2_037857 [Sinanodonta woodiana]|uniref:Intraflagellar transport 43 n=1 Tax=Sinanodonta woodiana TaxID=1069815 RepID=A0ABD3WN50_SINWO